MECADPPKAGREKREFAIVTSVPVDADLGETLSLPALDETDTASPSS